MGILLDTSILGRLANRADVSHAVAMGIDRLSRDERIA